MTTPTRAPRKRTTKPAGKSTEAETPTEAAPIDDASDQQRVTFAMTQKDDTKGYRKFSPPKSSGCVGTLYVPLGTEEVKVLLVGPKG